MKVKLGVADRVADGGFHLMQAPRLVERRWWWLKGDRRLEDRVRARRAVRVDFADNPIEWDGMLQTVEQVFA